MLRSLKDMDRYTVTASDGDLGTVENFLFDDERWTVRDLVVQTGSIFNRRRVLISPVFFREVEWATRSFELALTMDKIKGSPGVDTDKPVSRQHERDYYGYYGYPYYWGCSGTWGAGAYPDALAPWGERATDRGYGARDDAGDVHLRSAKAVTGYDIRGSDGSIGVVEDFLVDDETWEVRYLAINTSHWWFGKKVLVAPEWTERISWEERSVHINLTREAIKNSPPWNGIAAMNREYETMLYHHYGRPAYWLKGTPLREATMPSQAGSHSA